MVVIAKHRALLEQLGLATLAQVKAFKGELVKNHKGRRDILRIKTIRPEGGELVLFLKRTWRPYKKDGLRSLLRRGRVWSIAREEWENSAALERAGLQAAGRVAFGEECGPCWENFSYLITEGAHGQQTVEQFLRECRVRVARRRVFDALAREIRRMHDAGLATPDLFTRHLFVDASATPPKFCFIDMARLDQKKQIGARLRARDLAALNVTAPLRCVCLRERLRFLKIYAGRLDRRLVSLVAARTSYLLQRRKFHDFLMAQ